MDETHPSRCLVCRAELPPQRTGRPRLYCSDAHRRVAARKMQFARLIGLRAGETAGLPVGDLRGPELDKATAAHLAVAAAPENLLRHVR